MVRSDSPLCYRSVGACARPAEGKTAKTHAPGLYVHAGFAIRLPRWAWSRIAPHQRTQGVTWEDDRHTLRRNGTGGVAAG